LNTNNIYIKNLNNEITDAIRITIGTPEEMNKIIYLFTSKEYLIPKMYCDFYIKNNIEILFLISPIENELKVCDIKEINEIINNINKKLNINIILIFNIPNKSKEEIVHYLAIMMVKFINKYSQKKKRIYLDFHIYNKKNLSIIQLFFNAFNYAMEYNYPVNLDDEKILQILTSHIKDILN
ncbi:MAG: hypothetical protein OEY79_03785, partial [Anaplasmataceae bacterium]|nr:hypothetical protein [Anaplasmataceae bacterium]